jgi:RHS repeat-associated protein
MTPGIVGESDLSGNLTDEYVFFDGERVARKSTNGVFYYFSDHLKTASVITDAAGVIKAESDYYPWGGELQFVANDSNHYKFTGKERDSETQLDYFGARYYSNGLGRWTTPDWAAKATAVPYAEFSDPQSLNLYTYVRNVPTTRLDQDGHCAGDGCKDMSLTVTVASQPSFKANDPQKSGTYKTGVSGYLKIEADYKGSPVSNLPMHEDVTTKTTKNGVPATNVKEVVPSDGVTNAKGQVPDKVGMELTTKTPASPQAVAGVAADQANNGYEMTQTQTLTFPGPNGETCTATYGRTLSNVDQNGNLNKTDSKTGSNYKLTPATQHPKVTEKKK